MLQVWLIVVLLMTPFGAFAGQADAPSVETSSSVEDQDLKLEGEEKVEAEKNRAQYFAERDAFKKEQQMLMEKIDAASSEAEKSRLKAELSSVRLKWKVRRKEWLAKRKQWLKKKQLAGELDSDW